MPTKQNIENNSHLKQNPFGVPDGYFKNLEKRLAQIPLEHAQPKVRYLTQRNVRIFAAAATIALVLSIGWLVQKPEADSSSLSADDIIALSENGYLPYTELDVLMVLNDQDFDEMPSTSESLSTDYLEATQPDLVEDYYLMQESL